MPNNISVENNFIGGLKTEFTGLNFPENACTSATNCVFSIIGDVLSREGIDFELNFFELQSTLGLPPGIAMNTYKWNNAGGDGNTQILVLQYGSHLVFYKSSGATIGSPLSAQAINNFFDFSAFMPAGSSGMVGNYECQFADGNGFLFVFHPLTDPFFVQIDPATNALQFNKITIQIRDFLGVTPEPGNPAVNFRPGTLTNEHSYNLQNQGWTNLNPWTAFSTTSNLTTGGNTVTMAVSPPNHTFLVASGITGPAPSQAVKINWSCSLTYQATGDGNYTTTASGTATGTIISYSGTTMVINVLSSTTFSLGSGGSVVSINNQNFTIASANILSTITTFDTATGNFPSNADIWWEFKDTTGTFNPATTVSQIPLSTAQAPQGHFILNAFNQDRSAISGVSGISVLNTNSRPTTGCWFQSRVWYTGVNASQNATGDMPYYTWTENIYFSQIISGSDTTMFGACYQANDPTDNRLFSLEPDDGGVILIQGTGPIFKLFPIQNGLLVFAANGIWVIRGNSGLGFTASDFSINKISAVKTISATSFVDVLGYPFFWNQEGIYRVAPTQQQAPYGFGGFDVEPLTVGTILSFYNNIPLDSKRFARGTYDPISYVLQWIYKSTQETGILSRYQFDSALSINVHNRAFYPYTFGSNGSCFINAINYVDYPSGNVNPTIKYLTTAIVGGNTQLTFSEERDNVNWVDFHSFDNVGVPYTAAFTTGYKVHGQAFKKFDPIYVEVYSNNSVPTSYFLQGVWDYALVNNSRVSAKQKIGVQNPITMASGIKYPNYGVIAAIPPKIVSIAPLAGFPLITRHTSFIYRGAATGSIPGVPQQGSSSGQFGFIRRRHKVRGHGEVLQLEFSSIPGNPFHIIGWSIPEHINIGA